MRQAAVQRALSLYFIMGTTNIAGGEKEAIAVLEAALAGGISCFQLREKGPGALSGSALQAFAVQCRSLCRSYGVPFIVNDDAELAMAADADGVHIGQNDGTAEDVRRRIGSGKWLGISAHSKEEARLAFAAGADYIGTGPIYPTATKKDAEPVKGTVLIEDIRSALPSFPIVGIGGVTAENCSAVIAAGADGVAVISAIASADYPAEAAKTFLAAMDIHI